MIEFEFADAVDVIGADGVRRKSPPVVLVGPQTRRMFDLHLQGTLQHFVTMFHPDGLQRLYDLPMPELSDRAYDARAVLGPWISRTWQTLGNLGSFEERVRFMDELLLRQSLQAPEGGGISHAANTMVLVGGRADLNALAGSAGLSTRQFARKFIRQVGVRPKLFARVARFEAALENKARFPALSWAHIAHEFGYYDQMHMVHDFGEFAGGAPGDVLARLEAVFVEPIRQMRSDAAATRPTDRPRLIL